MLKYCDSPKYFIDVFSIYLSFQKFNRFDFKPYNKSHLSLNILTKHID